jgi:N-acetylornithine carbamoyltransferase
VTLARPEGFDLTSDVMESGVTVVDDADRGYEGAHAVYAKSWAAPVFYGQFDAEAPLRAAARDWRVTAERMERTADGFFLHCLPVRRNVVVDDAVLDGPRSAVVHQAENRLWTTMAALARLSAGDRHG